MSDDWNVETHVELPPELALQLLASDHSGAALALSWSTLLEASARGTLSLRWLVARHGQRVRALALAHIVHRLRASNYLGSVAERVAALCARFGLRVLEYDVAYLEVPLMNRGGMFFMPDATPAERSTIWQHVLSATRALPCDALCVKLDEDDPTAARAASAAGLWLLPFVDNTLLTLPTDHSTSAWMKPLSSKRRTTTRRHRRRFADAGGVIEELSNPAEHASELLELFQRVADKNVREGSLPIPITLEAPFFQGLTSALGERVTVLGARLQGRLAGFALLLDAPDRCFLKFVGLDHTTASREAFVYMNLFYAAVERAAQSGKRAIDLGTSAYEVKERLGAVRTPSCYYVELRRPSMRPLQALLRMRFGRAQEPTVA